MKQLRLLILFTLLSIGVKAQNYVPYAPTGTTSVQPTYRFTQATPDSLNQLWWGINGKFFRAYSAVQSDARYQQRQDGVTGGLVTTISGTNAITTAGSWMIHGRSYSKSTSTTTAIPTVASGQQRQDIIYVDTLNRVLLATGTAGTSYTAPSIPDNTLAIANVFTTSAGSSSGDVILTPVYTTTNQYIYGNKAFQNAVTINSTRALYLTNIRTVPRTASRGNIVQDTDKYIGLDTTSYARKKYVDSLRAIGAGITSFNSRTGSVVPLQTDYATFYQPLEDQRVSTINTPKFAGVYEANQTSAPTTTGSTGTYVFSYNNRFAYKNIATGYIRQEYSNYPGDAIIKFPNLATTTLADSARVAIATTAGKTKTDSLNTALHTLDQTFSGNINITGGLTAAGNNNLTGTNNFNNNTYFRAGNTLSFIAPTGSQQYDINENGTGLSILNHAGTGGLNIVNNTLTDGTGAAYLKANQNITLTGGVTGSGTTSIATTLANGIVGIANLSATGTPSNTTYLRGDNTWATVSGATYANPTAQVGTTSINGSATTAMRSDAAPAINQAISPTMTGNWSFSQDPAATTPITGPVQISNPTPATSGNQKYSPMLWQYANLWYLYQTTPVSVPVGFGTQVIPSQPGGNATYNWFYSQNGSGAGTPIMTLGNTGGLTVNNVLQGNSTGNFVGSVQTGSSGVTSYFKSMATNGNVVSIGANAATATYTYTLPAAAPVAGQAQVTTSPTATSWQTVQLAFPFQTITTITTATNASVNNRYYMNGSSRIALTLPTTAAVNDVIYVVGIGAGGWTVSQNAGQVIHGNSSDTTVGTGGSIQSTYKANCVELRCTVANTDFTIINSNGSITIN